MPLEARFKMDALKSASKAKKRAENIEKAGGTIRRTMKIGASHILIYNPPPHRKK